MLKTWIKEKQGEKRGGGRKEKKRESAWASTGEQVCTRHYFKEHKTADDDYNDHFFYLSTSVFFKFLKAIAMFLLFEIALDSAPENLKSELPILLKEITTSSNLEESK